MSAELIIYAATRYRCPHCRRSYAVRPAAEAHMGRCFRNPDRRSRLTCKHWEWGDNGKECAIGALEHGPKCSTCGGVIEDPPGYCCFTKPVYDMTVLCNEWEVDA